MKKFRSAVRVVFGRTMIVFLLVLIQLMILFSSWIWLGDYLTYVYGSFTLLSAVVVIYILNEKSDPSFKMAWMIPVLVVPIFGTFFYIFVQLQLGTKMTNKRLKELITQTSPYLETPKEVMESLSFDPQLQHFALYMNRYGDASVYRNTEVTYFPLGENKFEELKKQLKEAKEFIFMEYFIVEHGEMWDTVLEILKQKVKEGVEVRMMYDGMCSIVLLPYHYPKELQKYGIQCHMFAPIKPALSTRQNNRDHRKIAVIDGKVAFTGGVNLADEYINKRVRFGHWKDTAIMLKGEAVKGFTLLFLQMWNVESRREEDYKKYMRSYSAQIRPELGYVIPYGDSPLDNEHVGEQVYLEILNHAKRYVHIMTPYLILDSQMMYGLTYAAKRGVEIVIIMPHIPDKKYAYLLARTYYAELITEGVKIYEYTPGFVHAKVFISDDERAVVGTINLDFRSLYLHFECAAFLYQNPVIKDIEEDFQNTLQKCQNISLQNCRNYNIFKKLIGRVLRLIAPLM